MINDEVLAKLARAFLFVTIEANQKLTYMLILIV